MGIYLRRLHLFGPVRDNVHIAQKTVKHTPVQKLYDAFVTILAGAHGLVEIKGIHLRRDSVVSVRYPKELDSAKSAVTLQRTDRHGILGQKPAHFPLSL